MREIKFRVWDKHEKKMGKVTGIIYSDVQHTLVRYQYVNDRGKIIDEQSHTDDKGHGVVTLLQYTGLKDKNGKEIYEGDIVEFNNCDYQRTAGHLDDEIIVGEVEYSCGVWGLKEANGQLHDLYISLVNDEEAEVIGNIYEHPHLLEVQND